MDAAVAKRESPAGRRNPLGLAIEAQGPEEIELAILAGIARDRRAPVT
jgi:xanthine/CO dehydrogenase XdhC/CoxF family maturation factor